MNAQLKSQDVFIDMEFVQNAILLLSWLKITNVLLKAVNNMKMEDAHIVMTLTFWQKLDLAPMKIAMKSEIKDVWNVLMDMISRKMVSVMLLIPIVGLMILRVFVSNVKKGTISLAKAVSKKNSDAIMLMEGVYHVEPRSNITLFHNPVKSMDAFNTF